MNDNLRIKNIRNVLKKHCPYEIAFDLKNKLNEIANNDYVQKYCNTEHINFISRHSDYLSLKKTHPQSTNHPYYLCLFSVITQHIYADNIKQILDKAIDIEKSKI